MTVNGVGKESFYLRVFLSGAAVALMLADGLPAYAAMGADDAVLDKVFREKGTLEIACALGTACRNIDGDMFPAAIGANRVWRAGPGEMNFRADTGVAFGGFISYAPPSRDNFCMAIAGSHRCVEVSVGGGSNSSCPNVIEVEANQDQCDAVADLLGLAPADVDYVVELNESNSGDAAKVFTCTGVVAQCLPATDITPEGVQAVAHEFLGGYDGRRGGGNNYY
jgi:hypothetical protein